MGFKTTTLKHLIFLILRRGFFNFLGPFTWSLWSLCIVFYLMYALAFYLISLANNSLLETRSRLISLAQSLSFFGTAFIQQEPEYKPCSFGEGLLSVVWRIFSILMLATYTANLVCVLLVFLFLLVG